MVSVKSLFRFRQKLTECSQCRTRSRAALTHLSPPSCTSVWCCRPSSSSLVASPTTKKPKVQRSWNPSRTWFHRYLLVCPTPWDDSTASGMRTSVKFRFSQEGMTPSARGRLHLPPQSQPFFTVQNVTVLPERAHETGRRGRSLSSQSSKLLQLHK